MEKQELKEWKAQNELLKTAYHNYLHALSQKEKDAANTQIQKVLEWGPFVNFCSQHFAAINGIGRYGLDYYSEQCIGMIDDIAEGRIDYEY